MCPPSEYLKGAPPPTLSLFFPTCPSTYTSSTFPSLFSDHPIHIHSPSRLNSWCLITPSTSPQGKSPPPPFSDSSFHHTDSVQMEHRNTFSHLRRKRFAQQASPLVSPPFEVSLFLLFSPLDPSRCHRQKHVKALPLAPSIIGLPISSGNTTDLIYGAEFEVRQPSWSCRLLIVVFLDCGAHITGTERSRFPRAPLKMSSHG